MVPDPTLIIPGDPVYYAGDAKEADLEPALFFYLPDCRAFGGLPKLD